jgi:hypothetical protein
MEDSNVRLAISKSKFFSYRFNRIWEGEPMLGAGVKLFSKLSYVLYKKRKALV